MSTAALCQTGSSNFPSITGAVENFGTVTGLTFSGGRTTAPFTGGVTGVVALDVELVVGDETAVGVVALAGAGSGVDDVTGTGCGTGAGDEVAGATFEGCAAGLITGV